MTPDYPTLIDAATWAFIRTTDAAYPPDTATLSIAEQRAIYDRMCSAFHRGYPAGVTATDRTFGGVPCRHYPGAKATVVYFHGGGFVVGGLHSHDDICAEIRATTGFHVVSVDYRLCPEHPHPAAFDDAVAATGAIAAELPAPLILAGDSAGGNLAAATAQAVGRNQALGIAGQILIYPGLGGNRNAGSYLTHAQAPMLTRDDVLFYARTRHAGAEPPPDPSFAPLSDSDFSGLPPTLAIAAECDPLADDAHAYAAALRAAGGKARSVTETGLVHGYLRARATVPRAAASFARITAAITAFAAGDWPFEDAS
ncbi:alpha/beta hydrolase fold domain-containing protein [Paragemmobacter straminiformis]|uniref:Alpha/beta hydrolase fold domain-containing protein n=1 Tax=Paragemmobacter straminiformis TaxID=2045119 RepID=A0A842IBB7_9RHOB|nr:alpha/beta hydrolase [Gemmobacter straminiformis]MBC2836394.1 alpha/beta hydrolase fold domain-containing protein [Gemmobacter straminiformis]